MVAESMGICLSVEAPGRFVEVPPLAQRLVAAELVGRTELQELFPLNPKTAINTIWCSSTR